MTRIIQLLKESFVLTIRHINCVSQQPASLIGWFNEDKTRKFLLQSDYDGNF